MIQTKKRFAILLVEADDDVASIIERVASSAFPEAMINRISALEETISYIKKMDILPKLILLTSYKRNSNGDSMDLRRLITDPLVHLRPILLLEYSSRKEDIEYYYQQGISAFHIKPETYAGWTKLIETIRDFWFIHARLVY